MRETPLIVNPSDDPIEAPEEFVKCCMCQRDVNAKDVPYNLAYGSIDNALCKQCGHVIVNIMATLSMMYQSNSITKQESFSLSSDVEECTCEQRVGAEVGARSCSHKESPTNHHDEPSQTTDPHKILSQETTDVEFMKRRVNIVMTRVSVMTRMLNDIKDEKKLLVALATELQGMEQWFARVINI